MRTINVASDFSSRLDNRNERQGDGQHTAIDFRRRYLEPLDNAEAWKNLNVFIALDFNDVLSLGPSFANEAFAYFTKYARPESIRKKIRFLNMSIVKAMILNQELEKGYSKR
ncbi:STAS-like domain-containing protein [Desulfocurvibacter africanus]|uniref:STAS-like domain-containing protein n=1 Tax=Desulfocurvibacter africanus TaxID=873 RepID=UPI00054CE648|nr:STAS-like domain-containing protein [Desulfocurvibacter africanus]